MTALVIRSFDGRLYVNILDQLFALKEIPKRLEKSKEFDEVKEPRTHKIYIFHRCPIHGSMHLSWRS